MISAKLRCSMPLTRSIRLTALAGALLLGTSACSGADVGSEEQNETWNRANNPAYVDDNFEYAVDRLPVDGYAAEDPIPADYWATYKDAINQQWDGRESLSPAAKFAQAFAKEGLEDVISSSYGIDRYKDSRTSCFADYDCQDLEDGSTCARRDQMDEYGVCIPTWWGLCHGWAPYAISEPAAVNPVDYNGVTFYPGDIEALFSLVYSKGLPVKFLSERCNEKAPDPDESGRIPDDECRDMNPGTLHIVATNLLGIRKVGFVEDRTYDVEVWNQPVSGFRVTNLTEDGKLREISVEEAVALLGLPEGSDYTYNPDAKRFYHVVLELNWITEANASRESHVGQERYTRTESYEYILETDEHGNVFGGEYVGASREHHPDFVWWPTDKPRGTIADGMITYADVAMLNDMAKVSE